MSRKTYPTDRIKSHFAHRLVRLMMRTCAAQEIGHMATMLVTFVVHTEDAKRYRSPVTFWNEQLMSLLGASWGQLDRARKKAIDSGWLHYEAGGKGKVGKYWALIPAAVAGLPDGAVDCGESEIIICIGEDTNAEQNVETTVRETGDKQEDNTEHSSLPLIPSPFPKDTHTPARREKELRLPKEADTERNREQLEKWQGERERRHGDRTSTIAWEASAMTWAGWTEQHWFDSLLLSTRVGSRDLCNADKDHQKRAGPSKEKKPSSSAVLSPEELDKYKNL